MADGSRRFPLPWRADKMPGGYVVRDANGQALAYLYSRDNDADARQADAQRLGEGGSEFRQASRRIDRHDGQDEGSGAREP